MKPVNENYRLPFPTRLRLIMDDMRVSQQELADFVGVKRQTIAQWKDGNTVPDIYGFKRLVEFFNVPYEYLLGETDSKQRENMLVTEKLGLSDKAISALLEIYNVQLEGRDKQDKVATLSEILSSMLEQDKFVPTMLYLQDSILQCEYSTTKESKYVSDSSMDEKEEESTKYLHSIGKTVMSACDMSDFYLSQANLEFQNVLRKVKDSLGNKTLREIYEHIDATEKFSIEEVRGIIERSESNGNSD